MLNKKGKLAPIKPIINYHLPCQLQDYFTG